MQKYDKIYYPAEGKSQTDYYMDREGDLVGLTELSNRIILTEKEMKELLIGAIEFSEQRPQYLPHQNAKEFFQSKTGIQL